MSISTLTQYHRGAIYELLNLGLSQNKIAEKIGVSKSTISLEVNRVTPYDPVLAQNDADIKRHNCGRNTVLTDKMRKTIENHLRLTWSPEEIADEFSFNFCSIYNWIYSGRIDYDINALPDKGRRRKRKIETRGTFKTGKSIEDRPDEINDRSVFGHWEMDTVLSSRGESKSCIATFVERKTRFLYILKIPNRASESMNIAIAKFMNLFGSTVKSFTTDHGKEFSNYENLELKYNIPIYFCHPYAPWERGTNEYFNRKIRWFFPKKTNFREVTTDSILESIELINNRPLKILNGSTAIKAFTEFSSECSD